MQRRSVLYAIIHNIIHQGYLPLVLTIQPEGVAQVAQDGIGLVQREVSILELGELPVQSGGLERAL